MAAFDADAGGTGLSKHIRSSGISETYDLAGFGEAQASAKSTLLTHHDDVQLVDGVTCA